MQSLKKVHLAAWFPTKGYVKLKSEKMLIENILIDYLISLYYDVNLYKQFL